MAHERENVIKRQIKTIAAKHKVLRNKYHHIINNSSKTKQKNCSTNTRANSVRVAREHKSERKGTKNGSEREKKEVVNELHNCCNNVHK